MVSKWLNKLFLIILVSPVCQEISRLLNYASDVLQAAQIVISMKKHYGQTMLSLSGQVLLALFKQKFRSTLTPSRMLINSSGQSAISYSSLLSRKLVQPTKFRLRV